MTYRIVREGDESDVNQAVDDALDFIDRALKKLDYCASHTADVHKMSTYKGIESQLGDLRQALEFS